MTPRRIPQPPTTSDLTYLTALDAPTEVLHTRMARTPRFVDATFERAQAINESIRGQSW